MSTPPLIWPTIILLLVARMMLTSTADLSSAEALLSLGGERAAPYHEFSGPIPPLLARIGESIVANREMGVRLAAPLMGLLAGWGIFRLGRALADTAVGSWVFIAACVTPLFHLQGILLSPGGCLCTCWIWSMLLLWWALHRASKLPTRWAAVGLTMGLGVLCHPLGLLAPVCAFGALAVVPLWQVQLKRSGPYLMLGAFALITISPLIWLLATNHGHMVLEGWFSGGEGGALTGLASLLRNAFIGLAPPLLFGVIWAAIASPAHRDEHRGMVFAMIFAAVPTVALILASLAGEVSSSLLLIAYLPMLIPLAYLWQKNVGIGKFRIVLRTTALILSAALALAIPCTDLLRKMNLQIPYPQSLAIFSDPSSGVRGWETLGITLQKLASDLRSDGEKGGVFLIAEEPELAAILDVYLQEVSLPQPKSGDPLVHVLPPNSSGSPYARWPRHDSLRGGVADQAPYLSCNALFVREADEEAPPPVAIADAFRQVDLISVAHVMRGSQALREIEIFACLHYEGETL